MKRICFFQLIWKTQGNNLTDNGDEDELKLDLYFHMAYFVGEKLCIRPNEILDNWSPSELMVEYGYLVNNIAKKNYANWEITKSGEMPKKRYVKFYGGN